ncbi:hypothetical protein T484DRAFT_3635846, partial [Baffinella frigidus]
QNPRCETRNPDLETRNPEPGTRNTKPGTRNTKHETRNPKHETRNPEPETRNPKPETRDPGSEARSTKPETRNRNGAERQRVSFCAPDGIVKSSGPFRVLSTPRIAGHRPLSFCSEVKPVVPHKAVIGLFLNVGFKVASSVCTRIGHVPGA